MYNLKRNILTAVRSAAIGLVALTGLTGCSSLINDDLDPCPQGVVLRFVYDYNMEFANAFPSQVDCLTLLVYDAQGRLVETRTETSSVLADENYRMILDLPAATYHFVAWGGMACGKPSFHFVNEPTVGSQLSQLAVSMNENCIDADPGKDLHPLFYGDLDLTIEDNMTEYKVATLYMMRDTNTIRILLQNTNLSPVDPDDFKFEITDNNTLLGWNNDVVPTQSGITYHPWATGQVTSGVANEGEDAVLAFAEFSTSRFIYRSGARLTVTNVHTGQVVLSIPLVNYLLLYKSLRYESMPAQEYLDRENHWDMILFLNDNVWISAYIYVNDWMVRLNSVDL